jgi:peptide/nickel transport system ATP-binding protein
MTLLVDIEGLSIRFPHLGTERPLVQEIDLTVKAGTCVALVGESGSGKSLTARSLLGLTGPNAKVTARRFLLNGQDARGYTEADWRRLRGTFAGLVLQDALVSLDPLRTVGKEAEETLLTHRLVANRAAAETKVHETFRRVGIPDPALRSRQYAHELSGGLRQRVLIAAAIAGNPALLIADEPTTALDLTVQAQVLTVLRARIAQGTGVLLISHDLALVGGLADQVHVIRDGRVVEAGSPREVLGRPRHVYTRRLLAAVPSLRSRGTLLSSGEKVSPPPPAQDTVLQVTGLTRRFARGRDATKLTALEDVSFDLRAGEVLGIVGESGSGKSTCAKIILGLLPPDAGEVRFLGQPWTGVSEAERRLRRRAMQYIPQDALSSFDPRYTVADIIAENLPSTQGGAHTRRARVAALLDDVGLEGDFARRHPRSLSGGQRQRVAIARALASEPRLIVCDEPVSALDVSVQAQVLDLLVGLRSRHGTALLLISHDLGVIEHISDRVLVFYQGRLVEQGEPDTVFAEPRHEFTRRLVGALNDIHTNAAASPTVDAASSVGISAISVRV